VTAVVASVPVAVSALVANSTIPGTVVEAAGASKPTFRNVHVNVPGEVSDTRNQSPRVAAVRGPPGGVIDPGVVTITYVLFVVELAAGSVAPTV
jgi:hypothetical protein